MASPYILIVEDSPHVASSISDTLEVMGYAAQIAGSAEEAFAALEGTTPDLILLDWMLPDLEGIEVLRRVRQGPHAEVPVIMLTAKGELDARLIGLEAGADDYLAKPFSIGELRARIAAVLRRTGPTG
jgi:two-component system, OmpR family, phosphate regulon response regulator PhoB